MFICSRKRDTSYGWVEDYVLVDWGDVFRTFHGEDQFFPGLVIEGFVFESLLVKRTVIGGIDEDILSTGI